MANEDSSQVTEHMSLSEIADLAGVQRSAVSNWRKRGVGFPKPVKVIGREERFLTTQVTEWLQATGRVPEGERPGSPDAYRKEPLTMGLEMALCVIVALSDAPEREQLLALPDGDIPQAARQAADRLESSGRVPAGALTSLLSETSVELLTTLAKTRSRLAGPGAGHLLAPRLRQQPEIAADLFEEIAARHDLDAGYLRQHGTHPAVAGLMAALLPDTPGTVFDPAAGQARLLLACAQQRNATKLIGTEIDEYAWAAAVQRLLVHGIPGAIQHSDALAVDAPNAANADGPRFPAVVCDPPFGTKGSPSDDLTLRFRRAASASADMQWVLHCLDHLELGGTAVVTQPLGTLFREGADAALRRQLVSEGWLKAVIALPPGLSAGTSVPPAVLLLEHKRTEARVSDVFFVDLSDLPTRYPAELAALTDDLLPAVATDIVRWRTEPTSFQPRPGITALVPILDLLGSEAPLTPSYWVNTQARLAARADWVRSHAEVVDTVAESANWVGIIEPPEPYLEWTIGEPPALLPVRTLVDVGRLELIRGENVDKADYTSTGHPVLTAASFGEDGGGMTAERHVANPLSSVTLPGDVVVLPRGRRVRAAVDAEGGHSVAAPLFALRLADGDTMRPELLAALVTSPRVQALASGSAMKSVSTKLLTLPRIDPRTTNVAGEYLEYLETLGRAAQDVLDRIETARESLITGLEAGAKAGEPG